MTVELIEGLSRTVGWSYRRLCVQAGVGYSSLMRWKERLRRGEPPVRRTGPKKAADLDREALYKRIGRLGHRRKLTLGSGKLYDAFRDRISRREYQWHVRRIRKEVNAQRLREMRRIEWTAPGSVWAMDETGRRGLPVKEKISIYQVRDLASRKGLCGRVGERRLAAEEVALNLDEMFALHGPPLVLKSDNAGNLTAGPMPDVLEEWGVLALVNPPHWPRYNGTMERSQRELKSTMRRLLEGVEPVDVSLVGMAAECSLSQLNGMPRRCLAGRTADRVFEDGRTVMAEYTEDRRKEVRDEVRTLAMDFMARMGRNDRRSRAKARRRALETWLHRHGLMTVSVGGRVLPSSQDFWSHE